ncbi:LytR/AlgR family response regulator transcription factor [Chryseobacterium sp. JK1]|uniref:LytR/AlgR family response regulator transcription factor n=1 Tax=Chryseobacterium sp. JK1 TaxID=874294 RepID=UPI003D68DA2B
MITCIVVDDEAHAIELLTLHIQQTPFLKLVGTAGNPMEALQLMNTEQIDLIFLDIQMPGMSGIEFLPLLKGKSKVILTTAFREYAIEGFEHNVVDYLLKPIFFPRFFQAAQRAQENIQQSRPGNHSEESDFMLIKTEYKGKMVKVRMNDIVYIESKSKYVTFHTKEGEKITTLLNIGSLEEKLSSVRFIRIHKSFIIAVPFITMIQGNTVYLEYTEDIIPIGQTYRESFMKAMSGKVVSNKNSTDPSVPEN